MKSKILDRPMFKKPTDETDVENVGIMQGFMDEDDDLDYAEYMKEEAPDEDSDMAGIMNRQPNSPEILMNNLRGDMRSIDARVEELADLVGFNAAAETPQDVLALLQPVFAAQQAPAMPQAMPPQAMPQGGIPQEGMPPEMMGGMPQEMPQAMPPEMMGGMPQEMPPEMMGGIGALAADQGPGMAEPVMMAKGGPVQYFNEGTDEDGVTRFDDTSSLEEMFALMGGDPSLMAGGAPSPDEVAAARQRLLAGASRQALPVPDLKSEVDRRIPEYEKLMGVDRGLSQAQILFELGQRAFNFGANVDDQGKPLRGSAAARLAGAVRTLPGSIGQIAGQMDQQRRAIRGAALQASEQNIQNMSRISGQMDVAQVRADAITVAAAERAAGKPPPGLKSNWDYQTLTELTGPFNRGEVTPEQRNLYIAAAVKQFKPTELEYTDDQGRKFTKRIPGIELPYVVDALKQAGLYNIVKEASMSGGVGMGETGNVAPRSAAMPQEGAQSFTGEPPVLIEGPEGSQELKRQQQIARDFTMLKSDFEAGKIKKADYDNRAGALNAESMQIKNVLEKKRQSQGAATPPAEAPPSFSGPTYFDSIDNAFGLTAGAARAIAGYIPLDAAGRVAPGKQQASSLINTLEREIMTPLRNSTYFSNPEIKQIELNANLGYSAFTSPDAAKNNAIALARTLYGLKNDALAKASDMSLDNTVTNKERAKAREITDAINKLGVPPPISTQGEFADLPEGTRYLGYSKTLQSWQVKTK